MATIRPMGPDDVPTSAAVWLRAFSALLDPTSGPDAQLDPDEVARTERRYHHFLGLDPGGSFVAEAEGTVVGIAVSHIRGEVFTLANLGVLPDHQDSGLGRSLLDAALGYAATVSVGYIFSSSDPRAIQRYAAAGFDVHPAMEVAGRPRAMPGASRLRLSDGSPADLALVDAIDLSITGRERPGDIAFLTSSGNSLYLEDGGAYALVSGGRLAGFAAVDEGVARRALVELLTGSATGEPVAGMWVTSSQQWAFDAAAEARATLRSRGAVMLRGLAAPPSPYLPNGIFA